MKFEILKTSSSSKGRAGILHTPHGTIETPVFMPVGTQATVKGLHTHQLREIGAQILLSNTYHLSIRPSEDVIETFGGLHQFMNWSGPILTDSGGYQVFSLAKRRKITEEGVIFSSHLDGKKLVFTPKSVIDSQLKFNSDICMPLDICTPYPASEKQVEDDMYRTHQWEEQAYDYWKNLGCENALFAIVQGGLYKEARKKSVDALTQFDFSGFAMGGLSVGEPAELMYEMVDFCTDLLPKEKPRYVMGVGYPENLRDQIHMGVDMFDCVIPTRLARHGHAYTVTGKINLRNQKHRLDRTPIDTSCECPTCKSYSKAYLRHLLIAGEMLAASLVSIHNIFHLIDTVKKQRNAILNS